MKTLENGIKAVMSSYNSRLKEITRQSGNRICFGFDPVLERIPLESGSIKERITLFFSKILDELENHGLRPASIKPNSAFFEQYGVEGFAALFQVVEEIRSRGMSVILDAKRGDIGRTAAAYARFAFDELGADALTLNPYLGWETLEPFLEYSKGGKGVYVLLKTSNPGSKDFQELISKGRPLYLHVLDKILEAKVDGAGAVVGGTHPEVLQEVLNLSAQAGQEVPLLIPGIGTQGAPVGELKEILSGNDCAIHRINASSSLLYAWENFENGIEEFPKAARIEFEKLLSQLA